LFNHHLGYAKEEDIKEAVKMKRNELQAISDEKGQSLHVLNLPRAILLKFMSNLEF
jgi:hypothetical protein